MESETCFVKITEELKYFKLYLLACKYEFVYRYIWNTLMYILVALQYYRYITNNIHTVAINEFPKQLTFAKR